MIIKGWASVFGQSDSHSDVTIPGCFIEDLKQFAFTRPMLLSHDTQQIIGRWDLIAERQIGDIQGLWCEGTVLDKDAQFWIKEKCLLGLSIGYAGRKEEQVYGIRKLQRVELEEISVTAVPMNRAARITECSEW